VARFDPRNRSRYWRAPDVPGLTMLHADFTTHDYAPHLHEAFVVAVTEAGGSEFSSRGLTKEAHTHTLLVFNPDEAHSGRMARSDRWRYRSLYVAEPAVKHVLAALGMDQPRYFTSNTFHDEDLVRSFLDTHRALESEPDPFKRQELLVRGFGELFSRHGEANHRIDPAPSDAATLEPVMRFARDQYAEQVTLDQMGQIAGLNPFQLIKLFNKIIGLTPHAYLTQLRLKAAIRHLRSGLPLAEAAVAAGFYDQSALNNHFKRAFGMTPLQYLRACDL